MLEELAKHTEAGAWAIASMLFFLAAWLVVALKTWRTRPERLAELARLPLSDDDGGATQAPRGESPRA